MDDERLGHTVSPHEECAVEEAVRLVEAHGGTSTVLTVGPPDAEEQLRAAVSTGVDQAVLVPTDGADWDPQRTAAAVVAAIGELEQADGPFDLVLFGNESADAGGFQVGIRVAVALGRPMVQGIKEVEVDGDTVRVSRPTGTTSEVYELPLPACLGVREGLNLPRYPTMRGRLVSRKATIAEVTVDGPAGGQSLVALESPPEQEVETEVLGSGPEAIERVISVLEDLKVLT
ncbi:electron transfer flavoprotein subunit beta/FixA family protein [Salsipaludibacter albus]|uniref:electron transfer flavoprotein subunit beta/FixA family protein n=1 Tax=Salsipaludibacter albus TaxID=2849650 RepID=UPI001EE3BC69